MARQNRLHSMQQRQNRERRFCSENSVDIDRLSDRGFPGRRSCRGMGVLQNGRRSNAMSGEFVFGSENTPYSSDLQMLKEQAERMTRALKEIETQIRKLSGDELS